MTQLQKIVAKAKTLRKSYPKLKWTDLIKKASKLVTPAKKSVSGIKRTIVKKYAPAIPLIKKRIETKSDYTSNFAMAGVKKKKAVKKSPARSLHKDTKSHNVNIKVLSGTDLHYYYDVLDRAYTRLRDAEDLYKLTKTHTLTERYTKAHKDSTLKLTKQKIMDLKEEIKLLREIIIKKTKKI